MLLDIAMRHGVPIQVPKNSEQELEFFKTFAADDELFVERLDLMCEKYFRILYSFGININEGEGHARNEDILSYKTCALAIQ